MTNGWLIAGCIFGGFMGMVLGMCGIFVTKEPVIFFSILIPSVIAFNAFVFHMSQ